MLFPVGNQVPETQLPSSACGLGEGGAWREEGAPEEGGGSEASLGRGILLWQAEVWAS